MENEKTVLVLDGGQRASLAVTRSLGKKGIRVAVGEAFCPNMAGSSKYCCRSIIYASPIETPQKFQEDLIHEVKAGGYDTLIPITDVTSFLVAQIYNELEKYVSIPIPTEESIGIGQDKGRVNKLALSLKIPIPSTFFVTSIAHLRLLGKKLSYPVVIKPRSSWIFKERKWIKGRVEYAFNDDELVEKYICSHNRIPWPMIQERIVGPGRGIFVLMNHGIPVVWFEHRRLREKPPWGGESVLRESVSIDPELQEYAFRILKSLDWHGVAMVEFKGDEQSGGTKLMEINGRFWGSLQLAVDAGVDFPYLLYLLNSKRRLSVPCSYKVGIRTRWLSGDLESLLMSFSHRNLVSLSPSRYSAFIRFLKTKQSHFDIFSKDDPGPCFVEALQNIKKLTGLSRFKY